jgi:hypothetical protein
MSYLTVKRNRGGRVGLNDFGMISMVRPPVPGIAEVQALVSAFNSDTYAGKSMGVMGGGYLCANVPKEKWPIYLRKWEEMNTLYPAAVKANPLRCFPTMVINGKIVGTDRDSNRQMATDWYAANLASHTVNIDLTPAVNTVPFGTPMSFNVSGQMPQTVGGKQYSYNFSDEQSARAYAQSIVDASGTVTIYQVPNPTAPPPIVPPPSITPPPTTGLPVQPTTMPLTQGPPPVLYDPTAPYTPSYGPVGGATTAGTPTYNPPPVDYAPPSSVIVSPTSTGQGIPQ